MSEPAQLTVFYDASCPLCSREIGFYKGLDGAEALRFIDISACEGQVVPGLSKHDAMRRFHVMHPDGRLSSGGVAFASLWASLPAFRGVGRFFLMKPWRCLLDGAYTVFLPLRPLLQRLARHLVRRP